MIFESFGPVDHVAVERTLAPIYFDVPLNGCFIVSVESESFWCCKVPLSFFDVPVFVGKPFQVFVSMPSFGPRKQL